MSGSDKINAGAGAHGDRRRSLKDQLVGIAPAWVTPAPEEWARTKAIGEEIRAKKPKCPTCGVHGGHIIGCPDRREPIRRKLGISTKSRDGMG